ncbi:MAG: aspartate carbamoyltransferase catalytic subunit [Polyangia bacterium]|jgi:aspartate carbamoyltransferase catalytic subunit|nr:aspartate carbamoyltransferase catalytic subunit [Polyangia bacterium]
MAFAHHSLLGIAQLSAEDIMTILRVAETFHEISERRIKKVPTLRGKTVVNFFMEPSTRTRASFEIAEKRLSADSLNFSPSTSSVTKGETLLDTAKNLQAMKPDILVMRHRAAGSPHFLAKHIEAAVINAGDGAHEHPTQALLDAFTMRRQGKAFGRLEVTIVGDIAHSRVARSNLLCLTKLGAHVRLCGPKTMLEPGLEALGARLYHDLDAALEGADVVMALRVQLERFGGDTLLPSAREYARCFGINRSRLERVKPDALVMHPGPINRGVEIEPEVADGERSVILEQVTSGVAVRMALLYLLSGGSPDAVAKD